EVRGLLHAPGEALGGEPPHAIERDLVGVLRQARRLGLVHDRPPRGRGGGPFHGRGRGRGRRGRGGLLLLAPGDRGLDVGAHDAPARAAPLDRGDVDAVLPGDAAGERRGGHPAARTAPRRRLRRYGGLGWRGLPIGGGLRTLLGRRLHLGRRSL